MASEVRFLFVDGALVHPRLLFNLGFATDETAAPSAFLDSVTVTMQDANQIFTTIYLAADAAGTLLAPPPPGTVVIDPATISTNAMAYPSLNPVLLNQRAFTLSALIPAQFVGGQINLYFDLFDNQDALASQAWFSNPTFGSVSEPQGLALLFLAGFGLRRFRHRSA